MKHAEKLLLIPEDKYSRMIEKINVDKMNVDDKSPSIRTNLNESVINDSENITTSSEKLNSVDTNNNEVIDNTNVSKTITKPNDIEFIKEIEEDENKSNSELENENQKDCYFKKQQKVVHRRGLVISRKKLTPKMKWLKF